MKITSTPRMRYRPRVDVEGTATYSVGWAYGKPTHITFRVKGQRDWVVELTAKEWQTIADFVQRQLDRRAS